MDVEPQVQPLSGKHVVLGVTGSIASYKAADIASKLRQSGATVEVVMLALRKRREEPVKAIAASVFFTALVFLAFLTLAQTRQPDRSPGILRRRAGRAGR